MQKKNAVNLHFFASLDISVRITYHRTVLCNKITNKIIIRGPKNTSTKIPYLNSPILVTPSTGSLIKSAPFISTTSTTSTSTPTSLPSTVVFKTPLNNIPVLGGLFSKATSRINLESSKHFLEKTSIKTDVLVNEAKKQTLEAIKRTPLVNDCLENLQKKPGICYLEANKLNGNLSAAKSYQDMLEGNFKINIQPQTYTTLDGFSKTAVCLFGHMYGQSDINDHGFFGHIKKVLSDGSYIFEGFCFTSSPVTILNISSQGNATTIFSNNIAIGNHKIFNFMPGKDIQRGFLGIFHLSFGAQPVALRFLHPQTLENAMAIHMEAHFLNNYVSPYINISCLENYVIKHKTNLYLENKNIFGSNDGEI